MKKITLILLVLIFIQINQSIAQNCPSGGGAWTDSDINYTDYYGNKGQVDYKYRNTAPFEIQLVIDWSTLTTDTYFLSDSTMMKLLTIAILKKVCNVGTPYHFMVDVYFEKECKAKVKAVIQVDQSLDVCCTEGGSYAEYLYERYAGGQNRHFVDVFKEVTCGIKCCFRRYWVSRNTPQQEVSISGGIGYSYTNCNPTTSYNDCLDGQPIPCIDGDCDEN